MGISDYTLSKLKAMQDARSLALQTEQARAAREAAQYRANMGYLQQLIGAGGSLATEVPGVITKFGEQQAQAALDEALAAAEAGEKGAAASPTAPGATPTTPAGAAAVANLVKPQPPVSQETKDKILGKAAPSIFDQQPTQSREPQPLKEGGSFADFMKEGQIAAMEKQAKVEAGGIPVRLQDEATRQLGIETNITRRENENYLNIYNQSKDAAAVGQAAAVKAMSSPESEEKVVVDIVTPAIEAMYPNATPEEKQKLVFQRVGQEILNGIYVEQEKERERAAKKGITVPQTKTDQNVRIEHIPLPQEDEKAAGKNLSTKPGTTITGQMGAVTPLSEAVREERMRSLFDVTLQASADNNIPELYKAAGVNQDYFTNLYNTYRGEVNRTNPELSPQQREVVVAKMVADNLRAIPAVRGGMPSGSTRPQADIPITEEDAAGRTMPRTGPAAAAAVRQLINSGVPPAAAVQDVTQSTSATPAAATTQPAALTSEQIKALTQRGGKSGPSTPGLVNPLETMEGEPEAAYRKRMQQLGKKPEEIEALVKQNYFIGKKGNVIDTGETPVTGGGPPVPPGIGPVMFARGMPIFGLEPQMLPGGAVEDYGTQPSSVSTTGQFPAAAAPTPEAPKAPITAAAPPSAPKEEEKSPAEKELDDKFGKDAGNIADPFVKAQQAFVKRLQEWKEPEYKQTSADAAKKIVADVWKNQPADNPLLNFLSFGQYNNKLAHAKSMAEKLVKKEIDGLREKDADKAKQDFLQTARLEANNLALMQKEINDKRKSQLHVSMSTTSPQKLIDKMQAFKEVDFMLNDTIQAGRDVLASKEKFPGGALKAMKMAKALALASTPAQITAAAGIGGVGITGNVQLNPQQVKDELLVKATQMMDAANMGSKAKTFSNILMGTIQQLGKAREGGKLTDKDLEFYLNNLVMMDAKDPADMLKSINYLKKVNARSNESWGKVYNSLFGDLGAGDIYSELSPEGFTAEDLALASQLGFGDYGPEASYGLGRVGVTPSLSGAAGNVLNAADVAAEEAKKRLGITKKKAMGAP